MIRANGQDIHLLPYLLAFLRGTGRNGGIIIGPSVCINPLTADPPIDGNVLKLAMAGLNAKGLCHGPDFMLPIDGNIHLPWAAHFATSG